MCEDEQISFRSNGRELVASGLCQAISAPCDGFGELQAEVLEAFERARRAGQSNPIMIGALPFDPAERSCLYVPERSAWRETPPPGEAASGAMPALLDQRSVPDETGFRHSVDHALAALRMTELRKAVLSVQRDLTFAADVPVGAVLGRLGARNPSGYRFRVPLPDGTVLIGVSPELLIRRTGTRILSNPLAGSAARRPDPDEDRRNADWLSHSEKNLHEHRLVVEDIAARLAKLCRRLDTPDRPSLIGTGELWHLSTRIEGELDDTEVTALQLACTLHPTPAVCGYPARAARRLIRRVEPFERGLFTGIVGWCDAKGDGEWVVTIRCGLVSGNRMRLFAGAGVVEASKPEAEWAEVQTKLGTMLRACGLAG